MSALHPIKINVHVGLHMAKAVATQVFSAIPAGHDDEMVLKPRPIKHPQDDHPCACLTIIVLNGVPRQQKTPGVMRRFRKAFVVFVFFDRRERIRL